MADPLTGGYGLRKLWGSLPVNYLYVSIWKCNFAAILQLEKFNYTVVYKFTLKKYKGIIRTQLFHEPSGVCGLKFEKHRDLNTVSRYLIVSFSGCSNKQESLALVIEDLMNEEISRVTL